MGVVKVVRSTRNDKPTRVQNIMGSTLRQIHSHFATLGIVIQHLRICIFQPVEDDLFDLILQNSVVILEPLRNISCFLLHGGRVEHSCREIGIRIDALRHRHTKPAQHDGDEAAGRIRGMNSFD
jgi:hypothetical protein